MRHASSRFTLDVYSQARKGAKRQAQQRVAQMILPENVDDAVPEISLEAARNDAGSPHPKLLGREVGAVIGYRIDLKKQTLRPRMERFGATHNGLGIANQLKEMVGTRRLELLTSTVSKILSEVIH